MTANVALLALLVTCRCPEDKLDEAAMLLGARRVPERMTDVLQMVRDVIKVVDMDT